MKITVENLCKSYNANTVLENISFQIEKKSIVAILGPNGVGKTTLLEILMTLKKPDSGNIFINGKNLKDEHNISDLRKEIGIVFQEGGMYAYLKLYEILDLFASFHGIDQIRIKHIIKKFKLTSHLNTKFENLSGGWKKRILLACAFLNNPDTLILDEPTTGLDPQATNDLWEEINDAKLDGVTTLLSTHSLEEVDMYADYVLILNNKGVLAYDTPSNLKEKYQKHYFKQVYFEIIDNKEI